MPEYSFPISVVMPCFNVEKYILASMQSILNQTFNNFELIIIDDGSTDQTAKIISGIKDNRIKLIKHRHNLGNYPARNTGISYASGKYIAMMDADDVALPNRLEVQFTYLEDHKRVGAIGSHFKFIDQHSNHLYKCESPTDYKNFKIFLLRNNCMLQSSIMVRRHLVRKYNLFYNTQYRYAADYDFVWRCSCHFPIFNIPEVLVHYRIHNNQISGSQWEAQHALGRQIREEQFHRLGIKRDSENMSLIHKMMDGQYLSTAELREGCNLLNEILLTNRKKKQYINYRLYDFFQSILTNYLIDSQRQMQN